MQRLQPQWIPIKLQIVAALPLGTRLCVLVSYDRRHFTQVLVKVINVKVLSISCSFDGLVERTEQRVVWLGVLIVLQREPRAELDVQVTREPQLGAQLPFDGVQAAGSEATLINVFLEERFPSQQLLNLLRRRLTTVRHHLRPLMRHKQVAVAHALVTVGLLRQSLEQLESLRFKLAVVINRANGVLVKRHRLVQAFLVVPFAFDAAYTAECDDSLAFVSRVCRHDVDHACVAHIVDVGRDPASIVQLSHVVTSLVVATYEDG